MTGGTGGDLEIGAVAIGRNEGARLVRCLASLAALGVPTVYVDSASTDNSPAAARASGATVIGLDPALPFTAARARAAGAEALLAGHPALEFIQFVDGDCELVAGWLDQAEAFLRTHDDVAVVCGRRRERFAEASVYNRMADAEWNTPVGEAAACGGDALMRVAAYRAVGGFDPAMVAGEEPELCSRLRIAGWRIWRLDAAMTIHDAAMTSVRQWWRRAVRGGFGYAQAWSATRRHPAPLYARELARAAGWTIAPPLAALAAGLVHPAGLLLAPALYAAQIARIAVRAGGGRFAWQRAALLMLTKPAEAHGAWRWIRARARTGSANGTGVPLITYK